jgi:hypothetical protein
VSLLRGLTSAAVIAVPLRLLDYVELACIVLVQAMQAGWRSVGSDLQRQVFIARRAWKLTSALTNSDPEGLLVKACNLLPWALDSRSSQACGQAILDWKEASVRRFTESENAWLGPTSGHGMETLARHISKPPESDVRAFSGPASRREIEPISRAESLAGEHEAALVLEDMAMSRGKNVERIGPEKEFPPFGACCRVAEWDISHLRLGDAGALPEIDASGQRVLRTSVDIRTLPDATLARFLIQFYVSTNR